MTGAIVVVIAVLAAVLAAEQLGVADDHISFDCKITGKDHNHDT